MELNQRFTLKSTPNLIFSIKDIRDTKMRGMDKTMRLYVVDLYNKTDDTTSNDLKIPQSVIDGLNIIKL